MVKKLNTIKTKDVTKFINGQMVYCRHMGQYLQIKRKDVEKTGEKEETEVITYRCIVF